jgi:hypothetical protein
MALAWSENAFRAGLPQQSASERSGAAVRNLEEEEQ